MQSNLFLNIIEKVVILIKYRALHVISDGIESQTIHKKIPQDRSGNLNIVFTALPKNNNLASKMDMCNQQLENMSELTFHLMVCIISFENHSLCCVCDDKHLIVYIRIIFCLMRMHLVAVIKPFL